MTHSKTVQNKPKLFSFHLFQNSQQKSRVVDMILLQ